MKNSVARYSALGAYVFLLGSVSAVAPSIAHAQTKETLYIAANNQTVLLEQETALGRTGARVAYIRNTSTVPVIITQIQVLDCLNVKQYCGINKREIKVAPNERRRILQIEPEIVGRAMNFRFLYQWKPDGAYKATVGALAEAGDSASIRRMALIARREELARKEASYGDRILQIPHLRALADSIVSLRAEPASIEMTAGSHMFIEELRMLAIDKDGKVLGRVRGPMAWTYQRTPFTRITSPDSIIAVEPGSTQLQLRINAFTDSTLAARLAPAVFTIIVK